MGTPGFGPWEPIGLESVTELFEPAPFRWWISGGLALELHSGRSWRDHDDTDVAVRRVDLPALYAHLESWDVHVAASGKLTPWHGGQLLLDRHENNLWCRATPADPWLLDVTISEGTERYWIYRRDQTVCVAWDLAIARTSDGIPYLAPEWQLLYKSARPRPKDDRDAAEVIPTLSALQRDVLADHLDPDHPWRHLLA